MQALKVVGSYESVNDTFNLKINTSQNISRNQISRICNEMIEWEIQSFTLDFDDGNFIFFKQIDGFIRFIEGSQNEYAYLQNLVKNDSEGTIFHTIEASKEDLPKKQVNEYNLIHHSLLTPSKTFDEFFPKTEIFFRPYENPGGDFYWLKNYEDEILVVLGDCTGHGMQGAMISMSVMTLLKQHYANKPDTLQTSLYEFHDKLQGIIEEDETGIFDVELGAILINRNTNTLEFVGSGINMILKQEKDAFMYATRKARFVRKQQNSVHLTLQPGNQVILYSDGITDQFDAADTKKLGNRFLPLIRNLDYPLQLEDFIGSFHSFHQSTPQLDDQTMLIITV